MENKDRRIRERLKGYHLVKYRLFDKTKEEPYILSSVVNISASGILFKSNNPIALGIILDLKINFPASGEPVRTLAKVVRIREAKDKPKYYEVGAHFIEIEEQKTMIMDEEIKFVNGKLESEKRYRQKRGG